jgi:hypothetical protein
MKFNRKKRRLKRQKPMHRAFNLHRNLLGLTMKEKEDDKESPMRISLSFHLESFTHGFKIPLIS